MDLDLLKAKLAEQDAKLDRVVRLHATNLREIQLSKTKSSLQSLARGVVVELIMTIVAVVWLGSFIAEHLREPGFLVPALLVDAGLLALMGVCIRQLVLISGLDYGLPVVAVQKQLGRLRVLRIRTTKWVFVLSFALWFPVFVVLLKGLLGVDVWRVVSAAGERDGSFVAWMVANVLFGFAAAVAIIWVSNRFADRVEGSPALARFVDDIAGRSLVDATSALDEIARFESEGQSRAR